MGAAVRPLLPRDGAGWFSDGDELHLFASVLVGADAFETPKDLLYFFEKPAKWTAEHQRWILLGRPLEGVELETLQTEHLIGDDTWDNEGTPAKACLVCNSAWLADEEETDSCHSSYCANRPSVRGAW